MVGLGRALVIAALLCIVRAESEPAPDKAPISDAALLATLPFFGRFLIHPIADTFVIRQEPNAFKGYHNHVAIFGDTHYGFFLFDLKGVKAQVDAFKQNLEVKLRLYVMWAEDPEADVRLEHVKLRRPKWNDASLRWVHTENTEEDNPIAVTTVAKEEYIEFDVSDSIHHHLIGCTDESDKERTTDECRYFTFKVHTRKHKWVKFWSLDAPAADKHRRAALIFHRAPFKTFVKVSSDVAVVEQGAPFHNYGEWPTLDIINPSHTAFLHFDLSHIAAEIEDLQSPQRVLLRLYVVWAERAGSRLTARWVHLTEPLDEETFVFESTKDMTIGHDVDTHEVYTHEFVEFDITDFVRPLAEKGEDDELAHLHLQLFNDEHSWIKVGSAQYHEVDKRPVIALTPGGYWFNEGKSYSWLRYFAYFLLAPLPIIGIIVGCLFCGVGTYSYAQFRKKVRQISSSLPGAGPSDRGKFV